MVKTIIPHKCARCEGELFFTDKEHNYVYREKAHNYYYVCKSCFYSSKALQNSEVKK